MRIASCLGMSTAEGLERTEERLRVLRDPNEGLQRMQTRGLLDRNVVSALRHVPRRIFVPEPQSDYSDDVSIPLGRGQSIPEIELSAQMLQGLSLKGPERVLEIGTGSGFHTALLSRMAAEVHSVALDRKWFETARALLERLGCRNVHLTLGSGHGGLPNQAPYQAILIGGAIPDIPLDLIQQLDVHGRLVLAVGNETTQLLQRVRKLPVSIEIDTICACSLPLLDPRDDRPPSVPWICSKPWR